MNNQSTANTVDILGIHFLNTTEKAFQNILHKRINDGTNTFVVTANPEIVMYAKVIHHMKINSNGRLHYSRRNWHYHWCQNVEDTPTRKSNRL